MSGLAALALGTLLLLIIRGMLRQHIPESRAPRPPADHFGFLQRGTLLVSALADVLGVPLVVGPHFVDGPLGRACERLNDLDLQGAIEERDRQLASLRLLTLQLRLIRGHDPALLEVYRRVLLTGKDDEYAGTRFEISAAVFLIERSVRFAKAEAPDFRLEGDLAGLSIECTSAWIEAPKERDLSYKIRSVLGSKGRKPYATPTCCLFMDITNILHHMDEASQPTMFEGVLEATRQALRDTGFGGLVMFAYTFEDLHLRDQLVPAARAWRIDHPEGAPALSAILHRWCPGADPGFRALAIPRWS